MKKKFKNINEELNRIKELLVQNNLLLEDTSSCGSENSVLYIIKKILNKKFKDINLDDFKIDDIGCNISGTLNLPNYIYKFIFWEKRWFKIYKETKFDYFTPPNTNIKMTKQVFDGYYYISEDGENIIFGELISEDYFDINKKSKKLNPIINFLNKINTFQKFYNYIKERSTEEYKINLKMDVDRDIPFLEILKNSNWINEDDFDNITKTIEPYLNSNTYCYLDAKFYLKNKKHIGELIDDIYTIKFNKKVDDLIKKINKQQCK